MTPLNRHTPGPLRRILFVVPSLHGGGAEFVARTWMAWLTGRGYEVSAVLTAGKAAGEHVPAGVRVVSLSGARGHLKKTAALRRILQKTAPDVAISLQAHPNLLLLSAARLLPRARRPRVLISERNLVSLGLPGAALNHRVKIWFARRLYPWADHVIAISHPVAGELVAGFGVRGERITVVANPATAKVRPPERSTRRPGSDRGIQIVLACRLVSQKRPLLAIDAAAELIARGVPAEVVSFGGGPLLAEVLAAATMAGVPFTHRGWVENWFEHFGDNAVALLPSNREGFGNVLVEAAAAGYPAVAVSGALGVADAIVPGITGELALSASPADLADALLRAVELPLGENIQPWLRRFSVESSGTDLESVLLGTLGRTREPAPEPAREPARLGELEGELA
jgi:glycosyltransferase involved in cell wall biosynthesis